MSDRTVTITLQRIGAGEWSAQLLDPVAHFLLLVTAESAAEATEMAWRRYEKAVLSEVK